MFKIGNVLAACTKGSQASLLCNYQSRKKGLVLIKSIIPTYQNKLWGTNEKTVYQLVTSMSQSRRVTPAIKSLWLLDTDREVPVTQRP